MRLTSPRRQWGRRTRVLVAGALASVLALTACSGSQSSGGSSGSTTITIWTTSSAAPVGPGAEPAGWKAVTSAYESAHPGVKIDWKVYTPKQDPSSYQSLLTAIAGNNGPDIAAVDRFLTFEFASKGAIEPIQPYLSANSPVYAETKVIPGASFEQTVNKQLYGVTYPWQAVGFWSLCYNKQMFADAKLAPPKTWADVVTDTSRLTKISGGRYTQLGYEPYPGADATNWYYSQSNPTPLVSDNGNKADLTTPAAQAAVQQFANVMNAEGGYAKVTKFANPQNTLPSQDPFYTGHAAMDNCGDWYLQTIAEDYPKLPVGVVPLPPPSGGQPSGWAGGWGFQLVKGTKNAKPASQFLEYLMTKQASKTFLDAYTAYDTQHKLPNVIIGAVVFMYPDMVNADMADLKKASPDLYAATQHFIDVPKTYGTINIRPHTLAAGELFTDYDNAAVAAGLGSVSPLAALQKQNGLLQASITANGG